MVHFLHDLIFGQVLNVGDLNQEVVLLLHPPFLHLLDEPKVAYDLPLLLVVLEELEESFLVLLLEHLNLIDTGIDADFQFRQELNHPGRLALLLLLKYERGWATAETGESHHDH